MLQGKKMYEGSNPLYTLSKADSNLLKAIGILMIVFHNYLHWICQTGENEMDFDVTRVHHFMTLIIESPLSVFEATFSFLGHFGITLFIFISGYGLAKGWKKLKQPYFRYLFRRIAKLYSLLIAGIIFFYIYRFLSTGEYALQGKFSDLVFYFIFKVGNFRFGQIYNHIGPWWFFSLMLQFYILFPALFYLIEKTKVKGFIFTAILSITITGFLQYLLTNSVTHFPPMANAIGHLPEFMLGIAMAILPGLKFNGRIVLVSLMLFVLSCFFDFFFPLGAISILICLLYLILPLLSVPKENFFIQGLNFIGKISMFIFVTNGPLRKTTESYSQMFGGGLLGHFVAVILHTLIVVTISYIMYVLYKQAGKVIEKYTGFSIL